ncbi:MAG: nucleotidyltransferase domain-containing protein [Rhodothermales bacterium]
MSPLTRDTIVRLLEEQKSYLSDEFGVGRIGLFGSYAREQASAASDVDLLVELRRPIGFRFLELIDYLEFLLGRKVDLLTSAGLDNIRVESIAENIAKSVVYV